MPTNFDTSFIDDNGDVIYANHVAQYAMPINDLENDVDTLQTQIVSKSDVGHTHTMTEVSGTLPVTQGGTGATDAATALTNLGAQSQDASLDEISGLTMGKGDILVHDGTAVQKISPGTNGQVLQADSATSTGLTWGTVSGGGGGGASELNDLSDVALTSPADGDVLQFDNSMNDFVNRSASAAGLATSADLTSGLAGKSDTGHTHPISDVTNLQSELDGKQDDLTGTSDVPGLDTALAAKEDSANKGQANGYAELDSTGKVPASQLPPGSGGTVSIGAGEVGYGDTNGDLTSDSNLTYDGTDFVYSGPNAAQLEGAGTHSLALGYNASAGTDRSIAIGRESTVTTHVHNVAIGYLAQATNSNCTASGYNSEASGPSATAYGAAAKAPGNNGTALGVAADAVGIGGTSLGAQTEAQGSYDTSVGYSASASGGNATALGAIASATHSGSVAVGRSSTCSAVYGIAMGQASITSGSSGVSIGYSARASGSYSIALGYNCETLAPDSIALGRNSSAGSTQALAAGYAAEATGIRAIGVGFSSDALASDSVALGSLTIANASYAIAAGREAQATGVASVSLGYQTSASGSGALSMGDRAEATGNNSVASGYKSKASTGSSIAIGNQSDASGSAAISIGNQSAAAGSTSISIGQLSDATQARSIAIGELAQAIHIDSIALGYAATTTSANQFVATGNNGISDVYIGDGVVNVNPQPVTYHSTGGSGTDIAGAKLTLAGGKSTGAGAGGSVSIATAPASASGTTLNTLVDRFTIDGEGKMGFFGASPAAQSTGWSVSNPSNNTSLDVSTATLGDLRQVVGTLVDYLKNLGILGA